MPKSMSLMWSFVVDHDVFRLQVAMDDAVGVDVVESLENAVGDADGAVLGKSALVHDLAQQAALAPLHDHVDAGALFAAKDAHDVGVVEPFADAASRLKRSKRMGSASMSGWGILRATVRLSRRSVAR